MLKKSIIILLGVIFIAACGEGQKKENEKAEPDKKQGVEVKNYWMRPGAKDGNSAVYADIINHSDRPDTLYGISTDLSNVAQVHETFKKEDETMGMRHIDFIEVDANSTLQLKPGGYHLMLIKLQKDFMEGDKGKVTLVFKNAGEIEIMPPVKSGTGM